MSKPKPTIYVEFADGADPGPMLGPFRWVELHGQVLIADDTRPLAYWSPSRWAWVLIQPGHRFESYTNFLIINAWKVKR